jgi:PDZ domain-containing protein
VNTLGDHDGEPVLQIAGKKTYATSGHLNMTTVRVTSADYRMNLVEAVYGWLAHDNKVVPHETLYPDGKTEEQSTQENAEEFSQSQESAKVAALEELDIPVKSWVIVSTVVKDSPAEGRLHAGDVIKAVDGTAVKEPADVAELVTDHEPGQKAVFTIVPAKEQAAAEKENRAAAKTEDVTITTATSDDDGEKRAVVGISAGTDHTFPFTIDIKLADVGGPSAGLMFALGIYDKLTPGSLTGGTFVAGTGTIDDDGKVGPIGGIEMKTVGARNKGAQYFLTPADNCASAAKDTPEGLTLVKVDTIDDALDALKDIRSDDTSDLPTCTAS